MNIRFGANTQIWVGGFATKDFHLVDKVARMGCDFIEISYGEMEAPFDPKELKRLIDDAGLEISMCGYLSGERDITSADAAVRANGLKYFRGAAETGQVLGARIFAGPLYAELFRGRWLSADDRRAEWDRGAASLKEIGSMCGDHGMTVALEPLNRFETDFLNTAHQAVQMVEQVDSPHVKIHLDTFHMNIEEKRIGDAIREAGKHLVHFHTCSNDRGTPGAGHIPWGEVVDGLKAVDYSGFVGIEGFNPKDVPLANGGRTWRPVATAQDRVAIDGFEFLRKVFA